MADNSMASEERLRRLIGMIELLRRLKAKSWKRLQSLAYAFYVLVFAHLLLMLEPSAAGAWLCKKTLVYAVVFGGYFIARIWRAVCDRRAHIDLASTVADQDFKNQILPLLPVRPPMGNSLGGRLHFLFNERLFDIFAVNIVSADWYLVLKSCT